MNKVSIGLTGLVAGTAAGLYAGRSRLFSQLALMASPAPKNEEIIDTHHHFLPDFYFDTLGRDAVAGVTPSHEAPKWSLADDLAVMDDYGIRKAVISAPLGGGQEPSKEIPLASRLNAFSADMVRSRPDRYAHFATIPLPDIDASLAEAARALDTLGAVGLIVSTNYRGVYLGDPSFEPLWQELDRRQAVVFVHPTKPGYEIQGLPPGVLEFVFDTTRTVTSLLFSGTTRRFPNIKFILSHAGGTIPFVSSRLEGPTRMDAEIAKTLPNGVFPELKRFYWDTALAFSEPAIKSLLAITDVSKVTFGSDYPFAPKQVFPIGLRSLNKEISANGLADVLHNSALRIMPVLA